MDPISCKNVFQLFELSTATRPILNNEKQIWRLDFSFHTEL